MINDEILKAFKEQDPELTVMKIWNKGNLHIILAVYNPESWEWEMDPYYIYDDGKIDGIFLAQVKELITEVLIDENLSYENPLIKGGT